MAEKLKPKYTFYCPKCKKEISDYTLKTGIGECEDTPVGLVRTANDRAYCNACGEELYSSDLKKYNYFLMVKATMAVWRKNNPEGTRKQCRRALGLNKPTVDRMWPICLEELPEEIEIANAENAETAEK